MRLLSVTAFLLLAGLKNRVLAQLRRIRQPRYLVATLLGLAWWWLYFGRFLGGRGPARPIGEAWRLSLELGLTGLALGTLALGWLFGGDRGALAFTEAELQHLFPAPLTRRQLVHYKLLRLLATGLLGAAVTAFFLGRSLGGPPVLFALGSWVGLTTLSFHTLAAAFTRAGLARHGLAGLRRFALTAALLGAAGWVLWWAAGELEPPGLTGDPREDVLAWATAIDGAPLGWVLWPARAPVRLMLARDLPAFLAALPGALAVLALHYAWVMATVVRFEDDAVAEAARRAQRLDAARGGAPLPAARGGRRAPPFRLAPRGAPEVALLWKGLISAGRLFRPRVFLAAAVLVGTVALSLALSRLPDTLGGGAAGLVGLVAALVWAWLLLAGPGLIRADLRTDLASLDLLRTLPMTGAQLLRGQIAAPLAVLTALQWLCLPVAAALFPAEPAWRLGVAASAALLGPAFTVLALTLQNGFVILLPAWAPADGARSRGPEALGLRLISFLGHALALGLAVIPAAVLGGGIGLGAFALLGPAGLPAGAAVAAATLFAEAWLAAAFLGRAFDRLDPAGL